MSDRAVIGSLVRSPRRKKNEGYIFFFFFLVSSPPSRCDGAMRTFSSAFAIVSTGLGAEVSFQVRLLIRLCGGRRRGGRSPRGPDGRGLDGTAFHTVP